MKKIGLKTIGVLLSILIAFSVAGVFAVTAEAAGGIVSFGIAPAESETASDLSVINWFYSSKDKNYYLFAPETYDKTALKVWFNASAPVMCGETELVNGEVTDVFSGGDCTLTCGSTSYHVILLDGGDVPSVHINTESGTLDNVHADKSYKEPGVISIEDYDGTVQYNGVLDYIKGRGNSTWNSAKKPYNIKLNKKADLFGMGKSKKWCLLANAGDETLMRNLLAYRFAKTIGVDVTSDVIPVNLYINNNYMGAYSLTEKVEIGENRIDINDLESNTEKVNEAELDTYPLGGDQNSQDANTYQYVNIPNNPEDITGGYLLELEKIYRYPPENSGFITARKQAVVMKSPENASKEQVEYMRAYYQDYEDAVYSQSGYNSKGKYYTEYIDPESIARMYIAEEFGGNFDGCSSSFFLYKDIDGKITAGPAWDFDLSFAKTSGINGLINTTCSTDKPNSLYIQNCFINYDNKSYNSFLAQLFSHNDFQEVVQNVWNNVVKQIYSDFYTGIDTTAARLHSTAIMNAIRWNTYGTTNAGTIINNYNTKLNVVKNYISQRYTFLTKAYRDDTYFVKYDIGEYGQELVHDVVIYNKGDTFSVKKLPLSTTEACCVAWYDNCDYTGDPIVENQIITVNGNTKLYAKWNLHQWAQTELDPNWQCCEICGRFIENGELVEGWHGDRYYENGQMYRHGHKLDGYYYDFGDDGIYTGEKANGVLALEDGNYIYAENGVAQAKGLVLHNGDYYYFGLNTFALAEGNYSLSGDKMNGLLPGGSYLFRDHKIVFKNGIFKEGSEYYYYENNVKVKKGLVRTDDGGYMFFGANYKAFKEGRYDLPKDKMNGLMPAGNYLFENYRVKLKNGIYVENGKSYYYVENNKVKGAVQIGDDIYYFGANYYALADGSYYISASLLNGLLPAGTYRIENGIILREGLVVNNGKLYYYEDYKKKAGAVQVGDEIYYFGAQTYTSLDDGYYYISAKWLNGLLPAGNYKIEDGKILKTGLVENKGKYYYYENYAKKAGAVRVGDDIYYFGANTYTSLADGNYYISATWMNGVLPAGNYMIQGGKIVLKNGMYEEDGKLYYYENNKKVKKGLVIGDDGKYYYFSMNYYALKDGRYTLPENMMNGLLPAGKYTFVGYTIVL